MFRFCLLLLLYFCEPLMAQSPRPLPPDRLLDKLSTLLRGKLASPAEKRAFASSVEADPTHFMSVYRAQIEQWMQDPRYANTIADLHRVWWRVPGGTVAALAGEIVAQDRPYPEIYDRDYLYLDGDTSRVYQPYGVETLQDLPLDAARPVYISLAPEERRFRGFFSSLEFLVTYPDTLTNKNRKRSSQVFRIAFCETLQNLGANTFHPQSLDQDPHGSDPSCIGCHRRLDPMARFFDQWRPPGMAGLPPDFDSGEAASGAIHLGGLLGMDRQFPGQRDGALGKLVVAQPEFASCVSRLAWQYVFGTNVAIDAKSLQTLTDQYKSTQRFNPLVTSVLENPYFWSQVEAPPLRYQDVAPLLKNCAFCHARSSRTRFDPSAYPFRADAEENFELLQRIWFAVNHLPGARPMPEAPQPKLPVESLDALRNWISRGAEAAPGQATLNDAQVEAILQ